MDKMQERFVIVRTHTKRKVPVGDAARFGFVLDPTGGEYYSPKGFVRDIGHAEWFREYPTAVFEQIIRNNMQGVFQVEKVFYYLPT